MLTSPFLVATPFLESTLTGPTSSAQRHGEAGRYTAVRFNNSQINHLQLNRRQSGRSLRALGLLRAVFAWGGAVLKVRRVHTIPPRVFEPLVPVRTTARARVGDAPGARFTGRGGAGEAASAAPGPDLGHACS